MKLDPLERDTITATSLENAHWQLGHYFKKNIHHYIKNIHLKKNSRVLNEELNKISKVKLWIQNKAENASSEKKQLLKKVTNSYFACLKAWTAGAQIGKLLKNKDPQQIENFGLLLQNDNVGCQTSFIRYGEDILIWHVEEDINHTVQRSQIVTFDIIDKKKTWEKISFFVYPHLLPSAGFAFTKNYFQAIDFLSVNTGNLKVGSLANFLIWISFFYCHDENPEELIKAFLPSLDGYALNYLKSHRNDVQAKKILFAGHKMDIEKLKINNFEYLYQNNFLLNKNNNVHRYFFDPKNEIESYINKQRHFEDFYSTLNKSQDVSQLFLDLFKLTVFYDSVDGKPDYIPNCIKSFVFGFFSPKKALYYIGSSFEQTEATNEILNKKLNKKFIKQLHRIAV